MQTSTRPTWAGHIDDVKLEHLMVTDSDSFWSCYSIPYRRYPPFKRQLSEKASKSLNIMGLVDWKMTRVWENHSLLCANHPSLWRNECAVTYKWSKEAHPTWQTIESMVWTSLNATFRDKLDPSFYSLMTKSKQKVEQSAEFWDTHLLCLKQLRSFCPRQLNWRSKSTWFQFPQPSILINWPYVLPAGCDHSGETRDHRARFQTTGQAENASTDEVFREVHPGKRSGETGVGACKWPIKRKMLHEDIYIINDIH